jgi:hypothetical protein
MIRTLKRGATEEEKFAARTQATIVSLCTSRPATR